MKEADRLRRGDPDAANPPPGAAMKGIGGGLLDGRPEIGKVRRPYGGQHAQHVLTSQPVDRSVPDDRERVPSESLNPRGGVTGIGRLMARRDG